MTEARHSREFWVRLSAEVDAGEPVAVVAQRWRVQPRTLSWWRWQLRRSAPSKARFLPIVMRSGDAAPASGSTIELHVADVRIVVSQGTDVRYVSELVAALRAC